MFHFIFNRHNSVPRPSLYCVWIRAHEGENAPLISIWIDPTLSAFKSCGQPTSPEIEKTTTSSEGHEADALDRVHSEHLHFTLPPCG
jgi:hypothetical protein